TNVPSFAIEVYNPGTGKFDGGGTYLTRMHPIGVSYTAAQAVDPDLKNIPGSLSRILKGPNQTVECATCHDIHQTIGASATVSHDLVVDLEGGALCLTCHNK
ncbi:MAG TPA: cytochrome c3 family protein, partial [Candidatus Baltobacteraceae bacterium]|nr:cytochrome c3 family protein [Candidatus Baltobacteraceae bacterium]